MHGRIREALAGGFGRFGNERVKPNMKHIHKAVQALESDIGFWPPSWILLKKLENAETILQGKFPGANMHTANIWK